MEQKTWQFRKKKVASWALECVNGRSGLPLMMISRCWELSDGEIIGFKGHQYQH